MPIRVWPNVPVSSDAVYHNISDIPAYNIQHLCPTKVTNIESTQVILILITWRLGAAQSFLTGLCFLHTKRLAIDKDSDQILGR